MLRPSPRHAAVRQHHRIRVSVQLPLSSFGFHRSQGTSMVNMKRSRTRSRRPPAGGAAPTTAPELGSWRHDRYTVAEPGPHAGQSSADTTRTSSWLRASAKHRAPNAASGFATTPEHRVPNPRPASRDGADRPHGDWVGNRPADDRCAALLWILRIPGRRSPSEKSLPAALVSVQNAGERCRETASRSMARRRLRPPSQRRARSSVIESERFRESEPTRTMPFDLRFTMNYPRRVQRTTSEGYQVSKR